MRFALAVAVLAIILALIEWQILGYRADQHHIICEHKPTAYEYYYCEGK